MKKIMKKISAIGLSLTVMLSNLIGVNAFDQNILISNNITTPENLYVNADNYIGLTGTLKNNAAVVNHQYVTISQELFEQIDAKSDANNKYIAEQNKLLDEKKAALDTEKANVDKLAAIANAAGATQQQKDAYNTANTAYVNHVTEYQTYATNVGNTITSNNEALKNLIPSYNNNNWKQISLTESTTNINRYKLSLPDNRNYFVLWVKVTLNGKDYYQFQLYCNKEQPVTYTCEYKNGKWYNKAGKEVTEAEYKADCEEKKVCKIENGKYYNKAGKEVTEAEYKADCEEKKVCKVENGKYYNKAGKEVTEAEYKADCEEKKVCKVENGKYYDNNGFEVTKEDYEKACKVPENPKTGSNISYIYAVLISLVAISSYTVVRKAKKFTR